MSNIAYYHFYLTDNEAVWSSIFMEQMKYAEDSGLLDNLDVIKITAITQEDNRMRTFVNLCHTYPVKMEISFIKNSVTNDKQMLDGREGSGLITEIPTFARMYKDSQEKDFNLLYFHGKGITAFDKHLSHGDQHNVDTFKRYYYWRHYLNWGVLERWEECIKALDNHDMAGVNFSTDPEPHYSGSFWWAKSSHIRTLPNPETTDWWFELKQKTNDQWLKGAPIRYKDEHWATYKKDLKAYNVKGADRNPAFVTTPRKLYT